MASITRQHPRRGPSPVPSLPEICICQNCQSRISRAYESADDILCKIISAVNAIIGNLLSLQIYRRNHPLIYIEFYAIFLYSLYTSRSLFRVIQPLALQLQFQVYLTKPPNNISKKNPYGSKNGLYWVYTITDARLVRFSFFCFL